VRVGASGDALYGDRSLVPRANSLRANSLRTIVALRIARSTRGGFRIFFSKVTKASTNCKASYL
jgi:hypothetical protein